MHNPAHQAFTHLPLGQPNPKVTRYDPSLLCAVPRRRSGLKVVAPFGADLWTLYELSWLNSHRMPQTAIGHLKIDSNTCQLIESKSLKLYLYSLHNEVFQSPEALQACIEEDLSACCQGPASLTLAHSAPTNPLGCLDTYEDSLCLEDEIKCAWFPGPVQASLLHREATNQIVQEKLVTHLFKSNCLVTNQPDWASLRIEYKGPALDHRSLLRYLLSYRDHQGFHEQCVDQIFSDLSSLGTFEYLMVDARYTRRGGIDISPIRINCVTDFKTNNFGQKRSWRQ